MPYSPAKLDIAKLKVLRCGGDEFMNTCTTLIDVFDQLKVYNFLLIIQPDLPFFIILTINPPAGHGAMVVGCTLVRLAI